MLRLIQSDGFLRFAWNNRTDKTARNTDIQLEAYFNTYVLGDSVMESKYNS
jgi:hypothetical protein